MEVSGTLCTSCQHPLPSGAMRDHYYGLVTVTVPPGCDATLSLHCGFHGPMGGTERLTWNDACSLAPSSSTTPRPALPPRLPWVFDDQCLSCSTAEANQGIATRPAEWSAKLPSWTWSDSCTLCQIPESAPASAPYNERFGGGQCSSTTIYAGPEPYEACAAACDLWAGCTAFSHL